MTTLKIALAALAVLDSISGAQAYQLDNSQNNRWADIIRRARSEGYTFSKQCYADENPPYCALALESPPNIASSYTYLLIEIYDANDQLMHRPMCQFSQITRTGRCLDLDWHEGKTAMLDSTTNRWTVIQRGLVEPLSPR
jgi:hypothetical protein